MRFAPILVSALAMLPLSVARAQDAAPRPAAVTTRLETWHDAARGRDVEVMLYIPARAHPPEADTDAAAPRFPVVIFSHGLGGSREGYRYIGDHLAARGYLVILPTHQGSDTRAAQKELQNRLRPRAEGAPAKPPARGWLEESTSDPANLTSRPADISFVIDHLAADEPLHADTSRIAVAGHSFGAYTALAIAGMVVHLPDDPAHSFRDPRVKAAIAMSPQGSGAMHVRPGAWDGIQIPTLLLTGTRDYGQGQRIAAWRRQPFDEIKDAGTNRDAWLMVITGATHMTFATSGNRPLRKNTDGEAGPHQRLVLRAVDGFLDAHLRSQPEAMNWLQQAASEHRKDCTVETTAVPAAKTSASAEEPASAAAPAGK
jgi:predicted dienelactone hydrolase